MARTKQLAVVSGATSVEAVGEAACAGTGRGSCRTEIGRLIARHRKAPLSTPVQRIS